MFEKLVCVCLLALCIPCVVGCGGTKENSTTAPPAQVSENVDADRMKEQGSPDANVDYTKQNSN